MKVATSLHATAMFFVIGASTTFAAAEGSPHSKDAARLFEEAKAMADAGRWTDACPKLAESSRLEPNMTTEFRLADCYEHIGRSASAWTHYVASAHAASAAGETAKERFANERAAKLAPTVDRLVIVVASSPDLFVERDGRALLPSALNTPMPIDPGEHTVHAWSPGKSSFDALVTVAGKGTVVRVEVPPLENALPWRLSADAKPKPFLVGGPAAPAPAPASTKTEIARADSPRTQSSLRPLAIGLGIVGLAAIGTGTALYFNARDDHPESPCGDGRCTGSVALASAGGVALAIGGLLLLSSYLDH